MGYMDEALRERLVELAEEIEHSTFRETKWSRRGYSEKDVDDFLDYVVDVIAGLLSMDSSPHLMSVESDVTAGVSGEYLSDEDSELMEEPQPEVTWAPPSQPSAQPTVVVTSYEEPDKEAEVEAVVEVESEATVAWQPVDDDEGAGGEVAEVADAEPTPTGEPTIQPRPAGKPSRRPPGGSQPPLPPWAAHTG
ncbi:MAG: DivIVA domain-containing protein [Actinobacteria bacterium ATB1]|nr:DivIVA domain-containing protein [Actinobacteria bacterium ATB1]